MRIGVMDYDLLGIRIIIWRQFLGCPDGTSSNHLAKRILYERKAVLLVERNRGSIISMKSFGSETSLSSLFRTQLSNLTCIVANVLKTNQTTINNNKHTCRMKNSREDHLQLNPILKGIYFFEDAG